MKHNSGGHHRRSIRLKGYDCTQAGLYFITICTQNRLCLFGKIENGEMVLNDAGMMVKTVWYEIPVYYCKFNIYEFSVMPNHIHGIIQIKSNHVGAGPRACPDLGACHANECQQTNGESQETIECPQKPKGQPQGVAPTMSLSDIVHRYKILTTKRYADGVNHNDWPRFNKKLWQRNYYEHIIRNHESYLKITEYIQTNPLKWREDRYYE
jgi:putative transposase